MENVSKIKAIWARFRAEDAGAVTVDYVVLTASIVALSFAVLGSVAGGANNLGNDVGEDLAKFEMWGGEEDRPPRRE